MVKALVPSPTEPKAEEEAVANTAAHPPTDLPLTEEEYQRRKVDTVFASMDVRFKKAGKKVVKLPSYWDAKRKAKHPKVPSETFLFRL